MTSLRFSPAARVLTGLLAAGLLVTLFYSPSTTSAPNDIIMTDRSTGAGSPIPGLKVSLEQTTSSPLTVTAVVTNTNNEPVTILDYDSPLDSLALQLGLLKITAEGAAEPLELPTIQFRRVWPPSRDSLVTIAAGGSAKNEIPLKEPVVDVEELRGKPSVKMEGEWRAVWKGGKEGVSAEALDNPVGSHDVFTGKFGSESLEMRLN